MSSAGVPGDPVPGVGLAGRRAIVTGGAQGIGAHVVAHLASAGVRGVVLDLQLAQDVPPGWSAATVDVRDEGDVADAFARADHALGGVEVVVAAAGVVPAWTTVEEQRFPEWDEVFAVNARGVAVTLQAAAAVLGEGGSFVAVGSLNSWRGDGHLLSYVASKHAVLGVVRSGAIALGARGIRVNGVAPGPVATEALRARLAQRHEAGGPTEGESLRAAARQTALQRIATVDEVASAVLFLAGALSSSITGHLLPVDGGIQ